MDPGALLATTHDAGGGLRVRLRLARPSDGELVGELVERLSSESRRGFTAALPVVGEELTRHLTFYDVRRRLVVAATAPLAGRETAVGLADLYLLETGLAEIGLAVADDQHGRGVGKLLTDAAAALAARYGATHLKAVVPEENGAMRHLMERLGPTVRTYEERGLILYTRLPVGRSRAA